MNRKLTLYFKEKSTMIKTESVNVIFNLGTALEKIALKEINLMISQGQFVTVIGSNRAGKSTLRNFAIV